MFKITAMHREFWLLKKAPAFIRESMQPKQLKIGKVWIKPPFNINSIIPEVDERLTDYRKRSRAAKSLFYPTNQKRHHYHNAIHLLGSKMRHGRELILALSDLASDRSPAQLDRANIAMRWLRRIEENRAKIYIPDYEI
jgi:hypothetical protein